MKHIILFLLTLFLGIILVLLSGIRYTSDGYSYSGKLPVVTGSPINPITEIQKNSTGETVPLTVMSAKRSRMDSVSSFNSPALSLSAGSAEIHLETGSMNEPKDITIEGLGSENTPALDQGMVNVTGEHSAFRMLPHGEFEKDVTVVLPYDTTLIPTGYSEREIYTYYYHESLKRWMMLKRDSVDTENRLVVSKVNHFTDFINAIIKTPEMPETQAYTPTSIKDLKAANPIEGMSLFQPPTANNNGTANMNYPIEIPAGRQGMQPNLAVSYNSGGGNGWLGVGWDISIPSITVETRWGVPRYNASKESEVYLYQGEQLVTKNTEGKHEAMPHRTNVWKNRNTGGVKQFYPRVEEAFDSIVRHGTTPANYWWSVTDRYGNTSYYGKKHGEDSLNGSAVLRNAAGNIAHWALTETVDPYGNSVRYYYDLMTDYNDASGTGNPGKQLYLSSINYTGHYDPQHPNGYEAGKYNLVFHRLSGYRSDVTVNGRYGFKEVSARLLCNVQIWYEKELLVAYHFFTENNRNSGYKTRLTDMVRVDDPEFLPIIKCSNQLGDIPWGKCKALRYNFEYYDYPAAENLFGTASEQTFSNENVKSTFLTHAFNIGDGRASALSGTKGKSWNVGGTVALGVGANICMTTVSLGGNFGYSGSGNEGLLTLIDLDGDGLADKVFKQNGKIYYCKQTANSNGSFTFGNRVELGGLEDFLTESSENIDWGLQASAGLSLNGAWPTTTSTTTTYFSDVNGDGLPDLITEKNGVMFNSLQNGKPTFTPFQVLAAPEPGMPATAGTYVVTSATAPCGGIIFDGEVNDSIACRAELRYYTFCKTTDPVYPLYVDSGYVMVHHENSTACDVYKERIVCEPVLVDPDLDAVRVWVAPYSGTIDLYSGIQLLEDTSVSRRQSRFANGVRYSVQRNTGNIMFSSGVNSGSPFHSGSRSELFAGVIAKDNYSFIGDTVTNLTVSKNDILFFRLQSGGSRAFDNVNWTQQITYQDLSGTDDFGKEKSEYHSGEDFVLHGKSYFQAPAAGEVNVKGTLRTGYLYRNARLYIYRNSSVVNSYPLSSHTTYEIDRTFVVNQYDNIKFVISGDNGENTTWSNIHFTPRLTFTGTFEADNNPPVTDSLIYYPPMILDMAIYAHTDLEKRYKKLFGTLYRGWGQFCYNNNYPNGAITDLIDESKLVIPRNLATENSSEVDTNDFYLDESIGENMSEESITAAINAVYNPLSTDTRWVEMQPDCELGAWVGYGNINYIKMDTMSNTRTKRYIPTDAGDGQEEIPVYDSPVPLSIDGTPVKSVRKQNKSKLENYSFNAGIPVASVSMGASSSDGSNTILTDYMDLNGDRYPDIIGTSHVQYSNPWGGIGTMQPLLSPEICASSTSSSGQTFGASFLIPKRGASGNPKSSKISFDGSGSMGASHGMGRDYTDFMFMDVNGDGLPDKVFRDGNVSLNLGYTFMADENWKHNFIRNGQSSNVGVNMGGNFSLSQASIGGGIGLNMAGNETTHQLMDLNGDGLPDKLVKNANTLAVSYNLGNGNWAPAENLPVGIRQISSGKSFSESINASVTAGFTFFGILKFTIGVQTAPYNKSFSKEIEQFVDMNNDGYVDYVYSDNETGMTVRYNQAGKTNLLKRVTNFTGSYIELDYTMPLSSYEQPQRSWNLASVGTRDPFTPAEGAATLKTFEYEKPHYDRFERIAYGYGKVTVREFDTENGDQPYRYTVEEYNNRNFIKRGKKTRECLYDHNDRPYIETLYEAQLVDMNSGQPVGDEDCPAEAFPMFEADVTHYYEGGSTPRISTAKSRTYDKKRNVIEYINRGDLAIAADDFMAAIDYYTAMEHNMISLVREIAVKDSQGELLRRRRAQYDIKGKVTRIEQYRDADSMAVFDFEYDSYGNMIRMTFPENANGERNYYGYEYENTLHTYPARVSGALGYTSSAEYDYRWGKPVRTLDMNGHEMSYFYDNLGRLDSLVAPYELDTGLSFTIRMQRFPVNYKQFDIFSQPPVAFSSALTTHYDPEHTGNRIYTVIYCDGLGRLLQTQKKSEVEGQEVMLVSGKVVYDPFGRTTRQYHPVTVPFAEPDPYSGMLGSFCYDYDPATGTITKYDMLDRKTSVTLPDGSATSFAYGFGEDAFGKLRFMTTTTDALGNAVTMLADHRQLQTTVIASLNTVTSFEYTLLGELLSSTDPDGHTTRYKYNMLGQRTARVHPDAGVTEWRYDPAGNVVAMVTANLEGTGAIEYNYHYNQLSEIRYPQNPENNVKYTYGDTAALNNGKGRIVGIEDATGFQAFKYGKLGEVIENKRTFVLPFDHDGISYTFTMKWEYDSWNRIKQIIYPDGETVSYYYNRGGALNNMQSEKDGYTYDYITGIRYNEFESKTQIDYGNGTSVSYKYDILQRLEKLDSYASNGEAMQHIRYTYDPVSNITAIENMAGTVNGLGGAYRYDYAYDDLYRLTLSEGNWDNGYSYGLKMDYDPDGKITRKGVNAQGNILQAGYDNYYEYYVDQPHTLRNVGDEQFFEWDKNGNMTWHKNTNSTRTLCWDEENRLMGIADDNMAGLYLYDAGGERTVKLTGSSEWLDINGTLTRFTYLDNPTLYTSPYLVASQKGYTKHYYIENQRLASRIGAGDLMLYDQEPVQPQDSCERKAQKVKNLSYHTVLCVGVNYDYLYMNQSGCEEKLKGWFAHLYCPEKVLPPSKEEVYFYHPDHLGSSSWITDIVGSPIQHMSYLPFGEEFVDQQTSDWSAAYKFSGKEKDAETGYNYFGARYYMSDLSIWASVDPLSDKYPSLSPYVYCANNPIIIIDPDGRDLILTGKKENVNATVKLMNESVGRKVFKADNKTGNISAKKLNDNQYNKLSESGKAFYNLAEGIANDKDKKVAIGVERNANDVFIGNYDSEKIDIGDIKAIGKGEGLNSSSALAHELGEQIQKQTNRGTEAGNRTNSHAAGKVAEESVSGYHRGSESGNHFGNGNFSISIPYTKGDKTVTVKMRSTKNNLINISRQ